MTGIQVMSEGPWTPVLHKSYRSTSYHQPLLVFVCCIIYVLPLKLSGLVQWVFMISQFLCVRSCLARWFWIRASDEVAGQVWARPVVIWRLKGQRSHLQDGRLTGLLAGDPSSLSWGSVRKGAQRSLQCGTDSPWSGGSKSENQREATMPFVT